MKNKLLEEKLKVEHNKAKAAFENMQKLKLKIQVEKLIKQRDEYKRQLENLIYENVKLNLEL